MRRRIAGMALALTAVAGPIYEERAAFAQQPATTVQLPTFSYFTGGTTLTVPDRGSALMGGIKRAATGRNEFGVPLLPWRPFRNAAFGTERSASNVHVTATIHDFEAMDKLLLSQRTLPRAPLVRDLRGLRQVPAAGGPPRALASRADSPPSATGQGVAVPASSAARPVMSVARARALHAREQDARAERLAEFLRRGQEAEAAGKRSTAKAYYQLVLREATGELRGQAAARLEAIRRNEASPSLARR